MSRRRTLQFVLALAATGALLAGCGHSDAPVSSTGAASTSSGTSGAQALDALSATMQAGDTLVHGPCIAFGLPILVPRGCPYDSTTGAHTCGAGFDHDGFTVTRSYQFLDGTGASQESFDSLTTASIKFASTLMGTIDQPWRYKEIDDHRELTVSGLEGSETTRTWDGSGTASHRDSVTANDGTRSLRSFTASTTVASVVVPAPFRRDSWPLSGTITTHLANSLGLDLTAVLTFNGTQFATLDVGDSTFTVDLGGHCLHGPGRRRGGGEGGEGGRH